MNEASETGMGKTKRTVRQKVAGKLKSATLARKNLKPLIKDIPNRLAETADQVLLGLSHTKQSIPTLLKQTLQRIEGNPNDLVGRVGRSVLERAETVRKQLLEKAEDSDARLKRWVPDWVKETSFARTAGEAAPLKTVATEAAAADAVEVRASAKKAKGVKASKGAVKAASSATQAKSPAKKSKRTAKA